MFIASRWFETIEDYINLELSTPKWKGNLLRFYYNPIQINKEFERELFPKLETLYLYEYNDNEYKEDKRIKKREIWYGVNKEEMKENKDTTKIYKNILTTTPNEINVNEKKLRIGNDTGLISIGNKCFIKNLTMKNIKIPSTIKSIGNHCFNGCEKLETLIIPNSVTQIGVSCFIGCSNLSEIYLSTSLREIPDACFVDCYKLKYIKIPNSVRIIGHHCFKNCKSLTEIELPKALKEIKYECFSICIK